MSTVNNSAPDRSAVLVLDLGGTHLRTALTLADGTLVARRRTRTPTEAQAMVEACIAELRATLAQSRAEGAPAPLALAISAPGPLDPFNGTLIDPPNLDHGLWGFPLAATLGEALGLAAVLERDTQVAALAEGRFGAARGLTDYVYLTVSTGIGGAVVSEGRLLRGADGLAGELGHLTVDLDGPPCGCGDRGHLEAIASGTAIARAAREAGLGNLDALAVAQAEDRGNERAALIMDAARRAFAAAAVSIADVFNPQRIVVGGGIAVGQGERLLGPARAAIKDRAFRRQAERVELVPAALGDDVGLVGGLALAALALFGEDRDLNKAAMTDDAADVPTPGATGDHVP